MCTPLPRGARVQTPYGKGCVNFVRMAGPNYVAPAAYSVLLDHKLQRPGYTGTVVAAEHVTSWVTEDINGGSR